MVEMIEEWKPEKVVDFILACRRDEGIPVFVTRFGKVRLGGVLAKCMFGHDGVKSRFFINVPAKEIENLEKSVGDWRVLINKYGKPREIEEAFKYGIHIKGFKLPKIVKRD